MTITNGALCDYARPILRHDILALVMTGRMEKLDVEPKGWIVSAPVVHFALFPKRHSAPITNGGPCDLTNPNRKMSMSASFLFQAISQAIFPLLDSLIKLDLWAFAVFALISVRFIAVFPGGIVLNNMLLAVIAVSILRRSRPRLLADARSLHSLFTAPRTARFAMSAVSARLMSVNIEIGKRLRLATKNTQFVGTYFSIHDNNYITRKESVI